MIAHLLTLATHSDARGHLVSLNPFVEVPFAIERVFYIYGNSEGLDRAGHAHRVSSQLLIAVAGHCSATVEDREGQRTYVLDRPDLALVAPPSTWLDLSDFSADCVLLVLSEGPYQPDQTITDLAVFRETLR